MSKASEANCSKLSLGSSHVEDTSTSSVTPLQPGGVLSQPTTRTT